MKMAKHLAEFLFPPNAVCIGCGDLSGADRDGLCDDCERELETRRVRSAEARCPLCMIPLQGDTCTGCGLLAGWIGRAAYAFAYDSPADSIVCRFKYSGAGNLDEWMALQMLHAPAADEILRSCDAIVCAPADRFRKSKRGYNQAQLLAAQIAKRTGLPLLDVLRRRPLVRKQVGLGRQQRMENLSGVITCTQDMSGRRILLIDDVRTTGATAAACAKALKASGAAQVDLLTFAGVEKG